MDEALVLPEDEPRWAKQAEMARWIFDNAMLMPLYTEAVVWPVGPNIDTWEPQGISYRWLSNWEFAPHRGEAMAAEPTPFQHGS